MASYYKYKNSKGQQFWYVKYSKPNGKRSSKRGFRTKSAAEKWLRSYLVDIDHYGNASNMDITFRMVYEKWLPAYCESVVDTTAHKTKQIFDNHILPALGDCKVVDITVPMLQKLVNHWNKILVKNDCELYTNLVLKRAVQIGYIHVNPMDSVILPKKKARASVNNFFNQKEFKQFLSYLKADYQTRNPRAFTMLWLAAATGMRRGEILGLAWDCVDFKHNVIFVKRSLKRSTHAYLGSPKNKSSIRKIAVDETTMNYLQQWKHQQHNEMIYFNFDTYKIKEQLVFSTYRDNKPMPEAAADKYINQITKEHHMKHVTFHGLRHTHATLLVEKDTNLKAVSERLGHSSMETTLRVYVNMDKQPNHDVANTFENLMK